MTTHMALGTSLIHVMMHGICTDFPSLVETCQKKPFSHGQDCLLI